MKKLFFEDSVDFIGSSIISAVNEGGNARKIMDTIIESANKKEFELDSKAIGIHLSFLFRVF